MFFICRDYLKAVAVGIGVPVIHLRRGANKATREIRIFSMPTRGVLNQNFRNENENIERYLDANDRFPARTTGVSTTDATGNTGTTVKATGALFQTNNVVADDYFHTDLNNKRSKIVTVVDEDTLTITDTGVTGNSLAFHVSPNDGRRIEKARKIKADQRLSFVVQFSHRTPELAYADFLNFNRNIGKFVYDGQFAQYVKKTDNTTIITDAKGNKIHIILGAYEALDNQHYGEMENMFIQEIEFLGAIYIVPDPSTGEIEFSKQAVIPNTSLT